MYQGLLLVMENFRKFSQVETFRKLSGNFPYDVRASFFSRLFFNRFIYVTVILCRHFALFLTFERFSGSTK
jgi:hypothetical protein